MANTWRPWTIALGTTLVFLLLIVVYTLKTGATEGTDSRNVSQLSHDFGTIALRPGDTRVGHVFEFTNPFNRDLRIADMISTCACTVANPSNPVAAAGDRLRIPIELKTLTPGVKREKVSVLFECGHRLDLHVEASVRVEEELRVSRKNLILSAEGQAEVAIYVLRYDDINPREPRIRTEGAVFAEFDDWRLLQEYSEQMDRPARWSGTIRVRLDDSAQAADSKLWIGQSDEQMTEVDVRMPKSHNFR